MAAATLKLTHWPYGLRIETVEGGLLLRPAKKARGDWGKRFRASKTDELAEIRSIKNSFDENEWEW
jgi:hypothetical protein